MPSAVVLACLLSTLALTSSADAREQEWEGRVGRRTLGYLGSTAASSGVDHGGNSNTAASSRLQPGVNAGLAFTALDETALSEVPAAGAEKAPLMAAAPDKALLDGLNSDTWSSIAAEPTGDGMGSMSGQGRQAWTPGAAPAPQGVSKVSVSPEMGGSKFAAWDRSTGAGNSTAYPENSMGAGSPCDSLQGGPTEWMRHDGALGLACAQQRAMADEHGQQGSLTDAHEAFKIVASQQLSPSLQSLLRRRLTLQEQMAANVSSAVAQSFMSAALHVNVRDTAGALRAISASAVGAVAQAARSADESRVVPYTPNGPGGKLIGSDFTSFFLTSASDPTISGMRLSPGNYTVNAGANPDSHLWILCNPGIPRQTPFVLDLGGSVLIFEDQMKAGFLISDCANVEVRGPVRAYHSSMPFTQGTVTAISNDKYQGYYWEVQIHEGFPADTVVGPDGNKKDFLMRFDPQSLQMPDDYYDAISTRRTKIASSPPTYRFSFDVAQVAGKAGDYVALRGKGAHGIMLKSNTNTTVSGITMHNVGVFFIIDWTGNGNMFLNNTLVPWPEAVGTAKMPVLMASNADGIHCLGASQGPHIIGNTIANAGDDAITIHGLYFIVAKVEPERKTVTIATGDLRGSIAAGSSIVAYVGEQLMILGSATVTSIKQVGNPLLPGARSRIVPSTDFSKQHYYEVALGAWPDSFAGLEFDNLVANPGHVGSGFEVQDNLIMNNRGRGILLKAGSGSVEGNTIIRPTFWPIQVMPESFWLEAGWSYDVRIANNYIEGPYGGILVGLMRLNEMGSGLYLNHRNITVVNNMLANVNYAPIIITSAINVTVGNNTIQNALCQNPSIGQGNRWLDGSSLIYADNVRGLHFDPPNQIINTANCIHGNYRRPITLGKNATDVTFADGRSFMA